MTILPLTAQVMMVGLSLIGTAMMASADTWYVATNSVANGPGMAWSNAFHTIQGGVDAASAGDMVLVINGVYSSGGAVTPGYACSNRVVITNDIVVRSVNGAEATIIEGAEATGGGNGAGAVRGVYMSTGTLIGFTVTNGHTMTSGTVSYDRAGGGVNMVGGDGVVSNCTLMGNSADYYGGGSYYGTLNNCTLTGNSAYDGGGSYHGTLNNCTLSGNSADDDGGGSAYGTLNNCTLTGNSTYDGGGGSYYGTLNTCTLSGNLSSGGGGSCWGTLNNCTLSDNSSSDDGGGSYGGALNNCTLTGNSTYVDGGGSYGGTLNNCIVYHNTAEGSGNDTFNGTLRHTCSSGASHGADGNITNAPLLVSVSHIAAVSLCVGAGTNTYASGTDIDGELWLNPPAMGCDEYHGAGSVTGELQVAILATKTNIVVGYEIAMSADIEGVLHANAWDFGDGVVVSNAVYVTHAWSSSGLYAVVLTAYSDSYPGGVSATQQVQVSSVEGSTIHVSDDSGNDANDGQSWATAKRTLQGGVDAQLLSGGWVLATNGVYSSGGAVTPGYACSNRVVITSDIVVRSVHGAESTIIEGAEATGGGNGAGAVRGVYMSTGTLIGFTVTNGHTMTSDDVSYDCSGGGVNMVGGDGVVSNCTLTGNSADYYGGGSYYGTLNNCTLTGNSAYDGGGSYHGTLNNCTLSGNSADDDGGGSAYGTLNNCTLSGNSADDDGGGSYYGTLNNCTLSGNSANYDGGGSYESILDNCTLTGNSAGDDGGGSTYGTLNNCTLSGNSANYGGGIYYGTLNNCTLTGNSASSYSGGNLRGTLNNCIVWGNTAPSYANWRYGTLNYCCTTPTNGISGGVGCITNNPQFVGGGDYHLSSSSFCINAGNNVYAPTNVSPYDLAGGERIVFDTVDMGAYERQYLLSSYNGPSGGGNSITLTNGTLGSGADITNVTVCGEQATITAQGVNWVEITLGIGASGGASGDIVIQSTSEGESTFADAYTYNPAGTMQDVFPTTGSWTGGYQVVISGTNLCNGSDVTNVTLCGTSVTSIDSQSATQVVVTASSGTPGTGDVVVSSISFGATTKSNAFEYLKEDQTINFGAIPAKTYGDAAFDAAATVSSGLVVSYTTSDSVVATNAANMIYITGAGTCEVVAMQSGNVYYHPAANVTNDLVVMQKLLTVAGATGDNKVYDGNTDATITGGSLVGVESGDTVMLNNASTGTFASDDVAVDVAVTSVMTLGGADAGNYSLSQPTLDADITAKGLTVTGATGDNKVYDGNTDATITGGSLVGVESGDTVMLNNASTGTFASDDVAVDVAVTSVMTLGGADAGNYSLSQPTLDADITAKGLTVTGATGDNKVYDGNTDATITGGSLVGVESGDIVMLNNATTGTFASASVAIDITVTSSMTLGGADAGNYTLKAQPTLEADITKADQIINFPAITDKVETNEVGLTATASSGLPVNFAVGSGLATISGETNLTFTGRGMVSIVASQAGDANRNAAPNVTNTFRVYGFYTLTIVSAHGIPVQPVGVYTNMADIILTNTVSSPDTQGMTQHVCIGWTMMGNEPQSGITTSCVMTVTNDATLTWQWNTNYWLDTEFGPHGTVDVADSWQPAGVTVTITATADPYYHFTNWMGDVSGDDVYANPFDLLIDLPKSVTAHFGENMASNNTPEWWLASYGWTNDFDQAAMDDQDEDGLFTWEERIAGTVPTNSESVLVMADFGLAYNTGNEVIGHIINWHSVSGRLYAIEYSADLINDSFAVLDGATNIPATPDFNVYTNTQHIGDSGMFYRINVRLAP